MDENSVNDDMLLAAIRRRLLEEIQAGGAGSSEAAQIINNVYGSAPVGSNGIVEGMSGGGGGQPGGDDFEYMVDISRRDQFDPEDPTRKIGWDKSVHRHRKKKVQDQLSR